MLSPAGARARQVGCDMSEGHEESAPYRQLRHAQREAHETAQGESRRAVMRTIYDNLWVLKWLCFTITEWFLTSFLMID